MGLLTDPPLLSQGFPTSLDTIMSCACIISYALMLVFPTCHAQATLRGSLTSVSNLFPDPCIIENLHSHRRLYAQSGDNMQDGVGAVTEDTKEYDDQKWHIASAGHGTYTITNAYSGRRLYAWNDEKDGVGAVCGGPVEADQKWSFIPAGTGAFNIVNAYSGRRLYATRDDMENGIGAVIEGETQDDDLRWEIQSTVLDNIISEGQCV